MGLFIGVAAFFRGTAFVLATPSVWPRAAVPVFVALLLFAGAGWLGLHEALVLAHHVVRSPIGAALLTALFAFPALLLALVVALTFAQPLSGWALDGIVRAQRRALNLPPPREAPLAATIAGSLWAALLGLAVGAPLVAALTLTGWLFPPAASVTVPLKLVVGALLVAWDLLDYPLAMHGLGVGARLRWIGRHFGAVLGFGLASIVFFMVPGLGLLALPCGVAGATRLAGRAPAT